MAQQGADLRIEAILLLELQGETFCQVAGEYAGRIERLELTKNALDHRQRRAELVRESLEICRKVPSLVHEIDQELANQPFNRVLQREARLIGEMLLECDLARHKRFEIAAFAVAEVRSLADGRPAVTNEV